MSTRQSWHGLSAQPWEQGCTAWARESLDHAAAGGQFWGAPPRVPSAPR